MESSPVSQWLMRAVRVDKSSSILLKELALMLKECFASAPAAHAAGSKSVASDAVYCRLTRASRRMGRLTPSAAT